MVKIITNADDFGYSKAINYGIIDSHQDGILTSTTLMPGMPGFDHAIMLAKQNLGLAIGIHLTLTCGKPVLEGHLSLVDKQGDFKKLSFYEDQATSVDDKEVYDEWKAQIEKVLEAGIKPTHLDSHHHIHTFKNNINIIKKLAKEYDLPIRNSFQDANIYRDDNIKCNDILIDPWSVNANEILNGDDVTSLLAKEIMRLVDEAKTNAVIEVMFHPAYLDKKIVSESSFAYPRIYETAALQNQELMKYLKESFTLCSFRDI